MFQNLTYIQRWATAYLMIIIRALPVKYKMEHDYVYLDVAFCKIIGSKVICCTIDVGDCTYKFSDHVFDTITKCNVHIQPGMCLY